MIIAVDCDGTIFKWGNYPEMGEEVPYAVATIKRLIASGHNIFIWTCRSGSAVIEMKDALDNLGIKYSGINYNANSADYSPKIYADLYIDDKGIYCPLIPQSNGEPYVDWLALEIWFKRNGYYTIEMGAGNNEL